MPSAVEGMERWRGVTWWVTLLALLPPPARCQLVGASVEDPCDADSHQVISGQVERSFNYRMPEKGTPLCDRLLAEGWYRFQSGAGGNMPTACPGAGFCGTQSPVWLKGSIPVPADGIVSRTACINQGKDCCVGTVEIRVRNCSSYTVYHLPPTPGCNLAYCAGHEVACPDGLTSRSGFTPCYFTNKIASAAVRQTTDSLGQEILFLCDVQLEDAATPAAFVVEVEWRVDGVLVATEEFTADQHRAGLLREDQWTMGQTISCKARLRHELVAKYGTPKESSPFFAGVKILSESPLRLKEGSSARYIQFVSTVPVLCAREQRPSECCTYLEFGMRTTGEAQRCANGDLVDRVGLPNCLQRVCADNWNSTQSVAVRARLDHLLDGDQSLRVDMRTQFSAHRQWTNYVLPPQQVEVIGDQTFEVCVVDMFMYTFDSFAYQHRQNGTFVLYKHDVLPYEVQVRFGPCARRELCICSVAVRVDDVMVAADICSLGIVRTWTLGREGGRPSSIPEGLRLQQLNGGRSYQIYMPSGTKVVWGPYLGYVRVYGSPSDLGLTRGLCGTFDRDQANDLSRPDGNVACRVAPYSECDDFSTAWRIAYDRSLFAGVFDRTLVLPSDEGQPYCACQYSESARRAAGQRPQLGARGQPGARSAARASSLLGRLPETGELVCTSTACSDRRARDFSASIFDDNEDLGFAAAPPELSARLAASAEYFPVGGFDTPAPPGGWSRQTALQFCRSYIEGAPVFGLCQSVRGATIDDKLAECAADILYSGSTLWAAATLDSYREDCRTEVYRNTSLWRRQGADQFPSPPAAVVSLLCLNDCSGHGRCDQGLCVCSRGYVGSDCSVDLNAGPRVTALQNSGLCDVTARPCRRVVIQGKNFANNPDLLCHFEIYNLDGTLSSPANVVQTQAEFLSFQQIVCPLPDLVIHSPGQQTSRQDRGDSNRAVMEVSVCYGDGPRSKPQQLLVYDGRCWDCAAAGSCQTRLSAPCFRPGQLLPVVPVLRFNFNFSGVNINVGGLPPPCSLPRDAGPCLGSERRYYYDFNSGACEAFNYGGCLGNGNNFRTMRECGDRCEKRPTEIDRSDVDLKPQFCFLPPNSGPCQKSLTRAFFDPSSGKCSEFSYGGCFGNANNFETSEECKTVCGGGTAVIPPSLTPNPVSTRFVDRSACALRLTEGQNCLFRPETRFYFNEARKRCQQYKYRGCGGNRNSFSSAADCEAVCLQARDASRVLDCTLPAERGSCPGGERAYYYDQGAGRCRSFTFSGCGGNANNFPTRKRCQTACGAARSARLVSTASTPTASDEQGGTPPGAASTEITPPGGAGTDGTPPGSTGTDGTPPGSTGTDGTPPGSTGTDGTPTGNAKRDGTELDEQRETEFEENDDTTEIPEERRDSRTAATAKKAGRRSRKKKGERGNEELATTLDGSIETTTEAVTASTVRYASAGDFGERQAGRQEVVKFERLVDPVTFSAATKSEQASVAFYTDPPFDSTTEEDLIVDSSSTELYLTSSRAEGTETTPAPTASTAAGSVATFEPSGRSRRPRPLGSQRGRSAVTPPADSGPGGASPAPRQRPTSLPPARAASSRRPRPLRKVLRRVIIPSTTASSAVEEVTSRRLIEASSRAVVTASGTSEPTEDADQRLASLGLDLSTVSVDPSSVAPDLISTDAGLDLSTVAPDLDLSSVARDLDLSSVAPDLSSVAPDLLRLRSGSEGTSRLSSVGPAVAPPLPDDGDARAIPLFTPDTTAAEGREVVPLFTQGVSGDGFIEGRTARALSLSDGGREAGAGFPPQSQTERTDIAARSRATTAISAPPARERPRKARLQQPKPVTDASQRPLASLTARTVGSTSPAPNPLRGRSPGRVSPVTSAPRPFPVPASVSTSRPRRPNSLRSPLRVVPAPDLTSEAPEGRSSADAVEPPLRARLLQVCLQPALTSRPTGCPVHTERIERFFYNQTTGRCETFLYPGCGATLNHFTTRSACQRTCRPLDMCFKPMPSGAATCTSGAIVTRYFFNVKTSVCEAVSYRECEELPNSFSDIENCILTCEAPSFLSTRL